MERKKKHREVEEMKRIKTYNYYKGMEEEERKE
jgi:hypothetical protein